MHLCSTIRQTRLNGLMVLHVYREKTIKLSCIVSIVNIGAIVI